MGGPCIDKGGTPRRSGAALLLLVMALAGCATTSRQGDETTGRPADPAELTQWVAKGRIALSSGEHGGGGSFVWQQRSERTELAVRGPLGAGGINVVTDGETLQLSDAGGQSVDGDAARAELERRLGTALPLGQMRYWMLGRPAPGDAEPDSSQPAGQAFRQDGWQVSYDGYRSVAGWTVPVRLTATAASVRVRIVVDDWQVPSP